jgi:hypothetical protein
MPANSRLSYLEPAPTHIVIATDRVCSMVEVKTLSWLSKIERWYIFISPNRLLAKNHSPELLNTRAEKTQKKPMRVTRLLEDRQPPDINCAAKRDLGFQPGHVAL